MDFDKYFTSLKAAYYEIISTDRKGDILSLSSKSLLKGFEGIPFSQLETREDLLKSGDRLRQFEAKAGEKTVYCVAGLTIIDDLLIFGIIVQMPEKPGDDLIGRLEFAIETACETAAIQKRNIDDTCREYKSNLVSTRQMQALLFPVFDNVNGLDIGAVYLPSKLMSGNFVDAFLLSDDVYQIVACVVSGYDATASFVGAAVRTLVRSLSSASTIPSGLINLLVQKLTKIVSGVNALVNVSVYQINTKTGRLTLSSFGSVDTLFYVARKKNAIALNETQIGKELAKRTTFRDITFTMESGDSILYYSKGVINAETEDGSRVFGMQGLWDKFKTGINLGSVDHTQSISQGIFEFINYAAIKDDILIVRAKKL